jgi:hypothetical protein
MNKTTIYIKLRDEGTNAWRPTQGELISDMIFRVLPVENYDAIDEHWEFPPGSLVRCIQQLISGEEVLVAIEKI